VSAPTLSAAGIDVYYGRVHAVRSASLQVGRGEIVALVGPNGAGKTSLIRALLGIERCRADRLQLAGEDISRLRPHERARQGLIAVPEGRSLFAGLTVRQNLEIPQLVRGGWDDARSERVLERFPRLRERLDQRAGSLSGGEQQMLAVGRALLSNPTILLLDEVSLGLHPTIVDGVYEALRAAIAEDHIPTLVVEQHLAKALEVSDRCYVMVRGEIVEEGASTTLRAETQRLTSMYLSAHTARHRRRDTDRPSRRASLSMVVDSSDKRRLHSAARRQGITVDELLERAVRVGLADSGDSPEMGPARRRTPSRAGAVRAGEEASS
jgi:branched-chain amino acid transport system ATP-binding protein